MLRPQHMLAPPSPLIKAHLILGDLDTDANWVHNRGQIEIELGKGHNDEDENERLYSIELLGL